MVLLEGLADQALQQLGRGRGELGWLDHGAATGPERGHERGHGQLEGVIPRRDDADHALGLAADRCLAGHQRHRRRNGARFGPFANVFGGVIGVLDDKGDFAKDAFLLGPIAEIAADCLADRIAILAAQIGDASEIALAQIERPVALMPEAIALAGEQGFHAFDLFGFGFAHGGLPCTGWAQIARIRRCGCLLQSSLRRASRS